MKECESEGTILGEIADESGLEGGHVGGGEVVQVL